MEPFLIMRLICLVSFAFATVGGNSCLRSCSTTKAYVCGSNARTYLNICHLQEASCKSPRTIGVSYNHACPRTMALTFSVSLVNLTLTPAMREAIEKKDVRYLALVQKALKGWYESIGIQWIDKFTVGIRKMRQEESMMVNHEVTMNFRDVNSTSILGDLYFNKVYEVEATFKEKAKSAHLNISGNVTTMDNMELVAIAGWTLWSSWSKCVPISGCGQGNRTRTRRYCMESCWDPDLILDLETSYEGCFRPCSGPTQLTLFENGKVVGNSLAVLPEYLLKLECKTDNVQPAVRFTWNLSRGDNSSVQSSRPANNTSTLTVRVRKQHNEVDVVCLARNTGSGKELNKSVTLIVMFGPTVMELLVNNGQCDPQTSKCQVNVGSSSVVTCKTDDVSPDVNITWLVLTPDKCMDRNKTSLFSNYSEEKSLGLYRGSATLVRKVVFVAHQENDGCKGRCKGENTLSGREVHMNLTLDVIYGPDDSAKLMLTGVAEAAEHAVVEGEPVNVTCSTRKCNPSCNISYFWHRPGQEYYSSLTTKKLEFVADKIDHNQTLTCVITNSRNKHFRKNLKAAISVLFGPSSVSIEGVLVKNGTAIISRGQKTALTCKSDDAYKQVEIRWLTTIPGQSINTSAVVGGYTFTSSFSFSPSISDDQKTITCLGQNRNSRITAATEGPIVIRVTDGPYQENITLRVDGKVIEGGRVTLTCLTPGCYPACFFRLTGRSFSNTSATSHLQFTQSFVASRDDHMRVIRCTASNKLLPNRTATAQVKLNVSYGPDQENITVLVDGKATEGGRMTLTCLTPVCYPACFFEWTGRPFSKSSAASHLQSTQSFVASRDDHMRVISCTAKNRVAPNMSATAHVKLNISYGPDQENLTLRVDGKATEGRRMTLTCLTPVCNPACYFEWTGRSFYKPSSASHLQSTQTFVASQDDNMRVIRCTATNKVEPNKTATAQVKLNVSYGPYQENITLVVDGKAIEGSRMTLTCLTPVCYPACYFEWTGRPFHQPSTTTQLQSTQVFVASRDDHMRAFRCIARNKVEPSTTANAHVKLNISYGPTSVVFTNRQTVCSNGTCIATAGKQVSIACRTDEVNPSVLMEIEVSIGEHTSTIAPTKQWDSGNMVTGTHTFTVTPDHHASRVVCTANNSLHPTIHAFSNFVLDVSVGPANVYFHQAGGFMKDNTVFAWPGHVVSLKCSTDFIRPDASMYFLGQNKKLRPLTKNQRSNGTREIEVKLSIKESERGQEITCKAFNSRDNDLAAIGKVSIDVIVGPTRITSFDCTGAKRHGNICEATLGEALHLNCITDKVLPNASIIFTIKKTRGPSVIVKPQVTKRSLDIYSAVTVVEVSRAHDKSELTCEARNAIDISLVVSQRILLEYKPSFLIKGPHSVSMTFTGGRVSKNKLVTSDGFAISIVCLSGVANWGSDVFITATKHGGKATYLAVTKQSFTNNTDLAKANLDVTLDYTSGVITCIAKNNRDYRIEVKKSIKLDVTGGPKTVTLQGIDGVSRVQGGEYVVNNGSISVLQCMAKGYPSIAMEFVAGNTKSRDERRHTSTGGVVEVTQTMTIVRTFASDQQEKFNCRAVNTRDNRIRANAMIKLKVVVDGNWAAWKEWGDCSSTCGNGWRESIRTCSNPPPSSNGGRFCPGHNSLFGVCTGNFPCDYYKRAYGYLWSWVKDPVAVKKVSIFAALTAIFSGLVLYSWYMRTVHIRETKDLINQDRHDFDAFVRKLAAYLQGNEETSEIESKDDECPWEKSRSVVRQKLKELKGTTGTNETPNVALKSFLQSWMMKRKNGGQSMDSENANTVKQKHMLQLNAFGSRISLLKSQSCSKLMNRDGLDNELAYRKQEFENRLGSCMNLLWRKSNPGLVDRDCLNKAFANLKHEFLKTKVVQANKTSCFKTIRTALNGYNLFVHANEQYEIVADKALVRDTQRHLLALALKSQYQDALNAEDDESMQWIARVVEANGLQTFIDVDLKVGYETRKSQQFFQNLSLAIFKMNRKHLHDLKRLTQPSAELHDTLAATLIVLGEREEDTRDWRFCQTMCHDSNTLYNKGLFWRIHRFKVDEVSYHEASRVLEILNKHNIQTVMEKSSLAGRLHQWAHAAACQSLNTTERRMSLPSRTCDEHGQQHIRDSEKSLQKAVSHDTTTDFTARHHFSVTTVSSRLKQRTSPWRKTSAEISRHMTRDTKRSHSLEPHESATSFSTKHRKVAPQPQLLHGRDLASRKSISDTASPPKGTSLAASANPGQETHVHPSILQQANTPIAAKTLEKECKGNESPESSSVENKKLEKHHKDIVSED